MVNDKYHGEIYSSNLTSYSYMICELLEGKFYDVQVLVRKIFNCFLFDQKLNFLLPIGILWHSFKASD